MIGAASSSQPVPWFLALLPLGPTTTTPQSDDEDDDHDRAMEALQQGRVRPLAEILAEVEPDLGGQVVGVEFDDEEGVYVYEFRVVTDAGRLREVYVDATSGRILDYRGRLMRILLVEDEPRIAADVATTLAADGYVVEISPDGEEAWFRGDTEDFDLIVLDLGLPRDGRPCDIETLAGCRPAYPGSGAHRSRSMGAARRGHRCRR